MQLNKVMITGTSRGLGYELVNRFYQAGVEVFAVVRDELSSERLEKNFPYNVFPIVADISKDESESIISSSLMKKTDHLDILINNAGVPGYEFQIQNVSTAEVADALNVHCLGVIRTVKATLEFLNRSTNPVIVNVSSRLGSLQMTQNKQFQHLQTSYSYRIAKAAQNMLTLCLGQELNEKGISVHAIHPGKLKTEIAAADADTDVATGAENIYQWLKNLDTVTPVEFIQPGVSKMLW